MADTPEQKPLGKVHKSITGGIKHVIEQILFNLIDYKDGGVERSAKINFKVDKLKKKRAAGK